MRGWIVFATFSAGIGALAPVHAGTVEHRTVFGSMVLVQEVRTRDPGQVPLLHMADEWTRLHLRWTAPVGDMMVEIVDDGHLLKIAVDGHGCSLSASHERYGRQTGEAALWRQMGAYLQQSAKGCPRLSATQATAYAQAFASSRDDFVAGVEALKKRATLVFKHDLARCRAPRDAAGVVQPPIGPLGASCDGME